MTDLTERFWAKVDREHPSGCWQWLAYRNCGGEGYGTFRMPEGKRYAHRVAYELIAGPVPEGLQLDHLCRNKACVNPAHLEPVTCRENLMRAPEIPSTQNAKKTHCDHGHPLSGDNLYVNPEGRRHCRECTRAAGRRYREMYPERARESAQRYRKNNLEQHAEYQRRLRARRKAAA